MQSPSSFEFRSVMLFAAVALGSTLAHAQNQPVSPFAGMSQSSAPHTTNTQSAVSQDAPKGSSPFAGMGNAAAATGGATADVQNRSNVPHATPGKDGKNKPHKAQMKKNAAHTGDHEAAPGAEVQNRSNTPHSTPGAPKTDPSPSGAR
ncbi:hypothetical protein SAMN05428957_10228 [Oryzisolibacter propanilivorax]|uniref:Uncharacterized protein n=2 Tax=Oryzisolibacter propanilivorax TaxID=1527607 RepID=A0A1G9Q4Q1_9BURK|nr:hypothetical protein SAMN05428957_10228 [Oryzisolibacter propanilivorax]